VGLQCLRVASLSLSLDIYIVLFVFRERTWEFPADVDYTQGNIIMFGRDEGVIVITGDQFRFFRLCDFLGSR